jgi:hypothetical protein
MVKFAATDRKIGTYRARFVRIDTEFPITDRQTGEDKLLWRWVFQETADSTTVGEIDCIQNPGWAQRSNNYKFLTGMLGRKPTEKDDTDNLIDRIFDVVWGPNQGGRETIVAVTRVADELADAMPVPELKGAALP